MIMTVIVIGIMMTKITVMKIMTSNNGDDNNNRKKNSKSRIKCI